MAGAILHSIGGDLNVGKICLSYLSSPDFAQQISLVPEVAARDITAIEMPIFDWIPSILGMDQGKWNTVRNSLIPTRLPRVTPAKIRRRGVSSRPAPTPSEIRDDWVYFSELDLPLH